MAHVEYFGDLDGVARAKCELVTALPASGVAVLNFDDPRVARMASASPCPVLGYAVEADAEVRAEDVVLDADLRPRFRLVTPWGRGDVTLAVHGVAAGPQRAGGGGDCLVVRRAARRLVASLASATGSPFRMEVHRVPDGPVLVVDCYNANPASTEAALRALAALPAQRRVALLGLMAELGRDTVPEHERMRRLADEWGIRGRRIPDRPLRPGPGGGRR